MNANFAPHQQRVVVERDELSLKIAKLSAFMGGMVYESLDEAERSRLRRQLTAMRGYEDALNERIAAFN